MKVIYRISDGGHPKIKPDYVTKRGIFLHFLKVFSGYDIYIIADNVSDDTFAFLSKYVNPSMIIRTSLGNTQSFIKAVSFAIENFNPNENVYLAEDDYLYTSDAPSVIEEGLTIADYVSGYDHPDKYINKNEGGPNPFISNGGEETRVMITKTKHWKITNSFCMTFAVIVKTMKEDFSVYLKYCQSHYPRDFELFTELKQYRKLISSIPAVSTHGETQWLSPFINWEKEVTNTL